MNKKEQALQKKKALKEKKAQTKHVNKDISIGVEAKPQSKNIDGVFLKEHFKGLSNDELVEMAKECESKGAFIDARNLYSFAGERLSLEGLFQAGELEKSGNLGTKDFVSAFVFSLSAAKLGYVPAMEAVALSYFSGVGVEKNEMKSAAFIFAAHRLEPNTVKETFNNLYGRIDAKTFKAGKAHANFTLFFANSSSSNFRKPDNVTTVGSSKGSTNLIKTQDPSYKSQSAEDSFKTGLNEENSSFKRLSPKGNHPFFNHIGGVLFVFVLLAGATWIEGWVDWIGLSVLIWFLIWLVYQMRKGSS